MHEDSLKVQVLWTKEQVRDGLLAEWLAATERWPELRRLIAQRTEAGWWAQLGRALSGQDAPPDEDARALLTRPGAAAWLRDAQSRGALLRYRAADERLRRWGM